MFESWHRSQAGQEFFCERGVAGIPGVYLIRPTIRLRGVARQSISRIDDAEVIGWVIREGSQHVMKQINHLGNDF